MTEYQRITLKESGEEVLVDQEEYLYAQAGIPYIKFIVYQEIFAPDGTVFPPDGRTSKIEPVEFLTLQPQDILKREHEWTEAAEYKLITEAEEAEKRDIAARAEYQRLAEEEMARRAALLKLPDQNGDCETLFG